MELDRSHVRKWKDLADAFLKQYKYNRPLMSDPLLERKVSLAGEGMKLIGASKCLRFHIYRFNVGIPGDRPIDLLSYWPAYKHSSSTAVSPFTATSSSMEEPIPTASPPPIAGESHSGGLPL